MKTLLLFAILALAINVFAQNKQPVNQKQPATFGSIENSVSRMEAVGFKIPTMFSGMKTGKAIKLIPASKLTSIQVIDSVYSWTWDTINIGWKLDRRTINVVYDGVNNMINSTDQTRVGNTWVNSEYDTYTYNANHKQTSELAKKWINNTWVNYSMSTWAYDTHNNNISYLVKTWNGTDWVNATQTLQEYDANNNLLSMLNQRNWNGSSWGIQNKDTYTYDAQNNMITSLSQMWMMTGWFNEMQIAYTYDAKNNLISELGKSWNGIAWADSYKTVYAYDASNNLLNELTQEWDGSQWINASKTVYTYNSNNQLLSELTQEWDGSQWVNSDKAAFTFNSNDLPTSVLFQMWDGEGSVWLNSFQWKFGYDANDFLKFSVTKFWDMDGTTIGDSTYIYYHTVVTGLPGLRSDNFAVYPNPSKGKFTISGSAINAVEIYNITGKLIYNDQRLSKQISTEIDLTGYAKGVYFIKISDGRRNYSRKLVIK